jgi:hypothetical protein
VVTRFIALFLLLGSLVPFAGLIPGGESDAGYIARLEDWVLGTALCGAIGALVWFVQRTRLRMAGNTDIAHATQDTHQTREPGAESAPHPHAAGARDLPFVLGSAVGAFLLYAMIAQWVFSGRPLLIDEIVYVLQARDYASGSLTHLTRLPREFFSIMHEVDFGARSYGQYPAGGPAMLVPAVWLGAEWLVGPFVGGLSVLCFALVLPVWTPEWSRTVRRAAVGLFALAPFGAFMFGSHMNHATTLFWLLVAVLGLSRAIREGASPWWGLLTGLGLGIAATIRPLDAVAFALPAGAWLGWRARRGGVPLSQWLLSGVGVALPVAALLAVNAQTTGHPLRFGYDVLWGAGHALGFHEAAWGAVHTPARGVELVSLYLTRLSSYLFETPFPALLLPAVGLWFARPLRAMDRYLLVAAGLVIVGYWAYWHDGNYLGPRFLFAILPVFVVWSVRGVVALRTRMGEGSPAWRGLQGALGVGVLYAVVTILAVRAPTYRNGLVSMRLDIEAEAARANVSDAVVLVQESWGAQLMVRLWAAGITRSDTELLYRHVDACRLEMALSELESAGVRDGDARARLQPLLADSAFVIRSDLSPDPTERMQPGTPYSPKCMARIMEDRRGFLLYAPWRLARDSNVYARWLPGREREVFSRYPGRPVYRVRRAGIAVDAPLVWERLALTDAQP